MGRENRLFGKKGIFFTLISLVIVTIITQIFTQGGAGIGNNEAMSARIQMMDGFISKIEDSFIPLALESSGYKGINKTVWRMDADDIWLLDPTKDLGSVIKNGTLEGPAFGGTVVIIDNNTLTNFTDRIEQIAAAAYGIDLDIEVHDVTLSQSSPWLIESMVNFSLTARSSSANWSRPHRVVESVLSIEGLQDPQYAVNTDGTYPKAIRRSSTQPTQWDDLGKLADFVVSGNYTSFVNSQAPSYLERFKEVPTASSCCGIESTINNDLLPLPLRNSQKSYADYEFWSSIEPCPNGGSPADLFDITEATITAATTVFRLDIDHINSYRIALTDASQITC